MRLRLALKEHTRKANAGALNHAAYAAFIHGLSMARDKVRNGKMLYLKDSGERWADLRTLPDDELHELYTLTRQLAERKLEAMRERERRWRDRSRR